MTDITHYEQVAIIIDDFEVYEQFMGIFLFYLSWMYYKIFKYCLIRLNLPISKCCVVSAMMAAAQWVGQKQEDIRRGDMLCLLTAMGIR